MPSRYKAGDFVQVEVVDEATEESELLWVKVSDSDDERRVVFGKLDTKPIVHTNMRLGMELAVSYNYIRGHRTATSVQSKTAMPQVVSYVLKIRKLGHSWSGHPPVHSSHASRAEAEAELADYVRQNWDAEMDGDPLPGDPAQMIDEYFVSVLETYEISEAVN
jgi:hypothetical protein